LTVTHASKHVRAHPKMKMIKFTYPLAVYDFFIQLKTISFIKDIMALPSFIMGVNGELKPKSTSIYHKRNPH